jgi:PAS domain S-box-containing protein
MTCSPLVRSTLGLPADNAVTFADFLRTVHSGDRDRIEQALKDAMTTGALYQVEYRCVWPDATVHWINARGQAFAGGEGGSLMMLGVILDITERKKAEEHLQLLMREVNHRAKNMLTLVQAIARQTAASNAADFVARFSERGGASTPAISRTHSSRRSQT